MNFHYLIYEFGHHYEFGQTAENISGTKKARYYFLKFNFTFN